MATTYVSPIGSGDKSGSSWANAAAIGGIDAMMKKAGAGGTVLLAADQGSYKVTAPISITASGVTVSGANRDGSVGEATFEGTRPVNWVKDAAAGNELFRIQKGADDLTFQNLQINNTGTAIRVGGDVKNLTIKHVDAENVQRFLEDYASGTSKTATITGLTVQDVDVAGYSKQAIRLQYDTSKVLIEDVRGDSRFQTGDSFAMGVHLEDTVHDVTFRRVAMENNATVDGTGSDYWQGDGFSAERGTYNISFIDTVSRGNTDAGYDIKSNNVTFLRALAENNGRNYRIWGDNVTIDSSVGLDPHKRGGISTQTQLWVNSGAENVKVVNSKFSDSGLGTKAVVNGGDVTFVNTRITVADGAAALLGTKPAGYIVAEVVKTVATGLFSGIAAYSNGAKILEAAIPTTVSVPANAAPTLVGAASLAAISAASASGDWVKVAMGTSSETIAATSKAEMFLIDQSAVTGADVIKGFGPNDFVVFAQALGDTNKDGMTTFGKDGLLNFANGGSLSFNKSVDGLRYIGQTDEGYVYGNTAVWKAGSVLPDAKETAAYVSTAAHESYTATNARETFFFDNARLGTGTDVIRGFGSDDVIVTSKAFADGNKDGLITAGNGAYGLGNGSAAIKLPEVGAKTGLRYLGQTEEGFLYGDTTVRPTGALESKLGANDTLSGGKADTATDRFFFDTSLDRGLGMDKVMNFGAKDVIATTDNLGTGVAGSKLYATGGVFSLGHDGLDLGGFSVNDTAGTSVTTLEFDGEKVVNGTHYFIYSAAGSAIGIDAIG
ncbi:hypothetical protein [Sphingomonas solaris]|uniref:Uncharacterized protein n=1 Tax=Alterirhizorhabdus solaris TaxID=2529389 RepID=A0A558QVT1_9SPHN|nr:hypothetical protein [Sphingomonas solaris]TVV71263.1 hypothetical protein FOY91_17250 [Sphingomonas solaris]